MKARGILEEAKSEGIKLEFDIDVDNEKPTSYKDIIYNKNQLQYVQQEVKELEKKFFELKEKQTLNNLDEYLENVKDYNGTKGLIMEVHDKDINLLKSIADNIVNQVGECFVFFANIKENGSINFLARSTNRVNAGLIVKDAAVSSEGNGGGSPTFAQGGGKNTEALEKIYAHIEKVLNNE
jgi:alanyl-tRNA synthetase